MQHRPYLVPLLWHSPLIVMQLSQGPVAALHGRRGALKGTHPVDSPGLPRLEGLGRQAWGECMLVQGALGSFQCLPELGFPAGTARVSYLVLPIDSGEQGLLSPPLP